MIKKKTKKKKFKATFDKYTMYDARWLTMFKVRFLSSGMSQTRFADMLGITQPVVSMYLSEIRCPEWSTVARISRQLKIDLNKVINDREG